MTQEGMLWKCDRCGNNMFVPRVGSQFNAIDGYAEESPKYQDHDPNWGHLSIYPIPPDNQRFPVLKGLESDFINRLLCPKCRAEFADLMYTFWRIEKNDPNSKSDPG